MRTALAATFKDKEFLADAAKLQLDIDPLSAKAITQIVRDTVNAPANVIAKAKAAIETASTR